MAVTIAVEDLGVLTSATRTELKALLEFVEWYGTLSFADSAMRKEATAHLENVLEPDMLTRLKDRDLVKADGATGSVTLASAGAIETAGAAQRGQVVHLPWFESVIEAREKHHRPLEANTDRNDNWCERIQPHLDRRTLHICRIVDRYALGWSDIAANRLEELVGATIIDRYAGEGSNEPFGWSKGLTYVLSMLQVASAHLYLPACDSKCLTEDKCNECNRQRKRDLTADESRGLTEYAVRTLPRVLGKRWPDRLQSINVHFVKRCCAGGFLHDRYLLFDDEIVFSSGTGVVEVFESSPLERRTTLTLQTKEDAGSLRQHIGRLKDESRTELLWTVSRNGSVASTKRSPRPRCNYKDPETGRRKYGPCWLDRSTYSGKPS